ncbi:MAG: hypothetical protein ILP08_03550, partial [Lachnospiraceae bacterium]|nr:hypothetical protein [Lachnospiraceae bacterium]
MEISEFFFGDDAIFETLRANYVSEYLSFDLDRPFQKSLTAEYLAAIDQMRAVTSPDGFQAAIDALDAAQ